MRDLEWERRITPNVVIGLDQSLSLVLVVENDCDTFHQVTISNGDELIEAIRDARLVRSHRELEWKR